MSSGHAPSTVLFNFSERDLAALIASCADDPLMPILRAHVPPGGKVLEAGAGSGRWIKALHDLGYDATGIELSRGDVDRFRAAWPTIPFDNGDIENMPYADAGFDAILSLGVIEHLMRGPERAMAEMRRVIKPGGVLLLTVPHANVSFVVERMKDAILHRVYSSRTLRRWLGKRPTGFSAAAQRETIARIDRERWNGLPVKYGFSPEAGKFFYEYRFTAAQLTELARRFGFSVEAVRVLYGDDRLYQIFGKLVGHYDGSHAPRLNPVGRMLAALLPRFWYGHMVLIVARA
jgi:SAM-dependent methyltransferase